MSGPVDDESWFVFGTHADGLVDVSNHHGDVLERVPAALAETMCRAHNSSIERVYALALHGMSVGGVEREELCVPEPFKSILEQIRRVESRIPKDDES